jgi:hypothetical protein
MGLRRLPAPRVRRLDSAHNTISIDGQNHASVEGAHHPLISVDRFEVTDDYAVISARHYAYAHLAGQPVVARTVWMDRRETLAAPVIIVDWTSASAVHTYTTSLTVPGDAVLADTGSIGAPEDQRIRPILSAGQTVRADPAFTTTSPPPAAPTAATRWSVAQTGKSVVFITVIGGSVTATLDQPLRRGRPITIRLQDPNAPDRIVSFDPPDLAPPAATIVATASAAAAPRPTSVFSTRPVPAAATVVELTPEHALLA